MTELIGYTALSFFLVGSYRWLALRHRWLDHPNERSSHRMVTPRGAGIVFALLITGAALFRITDQVPIPLSFLPAFAVALIGWRDDLHGLTAPRRLALYCLCAAGIAITVGAPVIVLPSLSFLTVAALTLITVLALAWLINLYNFMDGINGIAGGQALFVLGAILWLGADTPFYVQLGPLLWVALYAIAGFLPWNFPHGRIFMGDAGSAYLGALMGLLILWSLRLDGPSVCSWLILLALFITDTGYTLTVRVLSRQRWYAAHRLHSYQRLSDHLQSHALTVLILIGVNIVWLLPWAYLARTGGWIGVCAVTAAYTPLLAACYYLKAGIPARSAV